MPELTNSHRRILKATYAPVQTRKGPEIRAALAQASVLEALRPTETEMTLLQRRPELAGSRELQSTLAAVRNLTSASGHQARYVAVRELAENDTQSVRRIAQAIVDQREDDLNRLESELATLKQELREAPAEDDTDADDTSDGGTVLDNTGRLTPIQRRGTIAGRVTVGPQVVTSPTTRSTFSAEPSAPMQTGLESILQRGLDQTSGSFNALSRVAADRAPVHPVYSTTSDERRIGHALAEMKEVFELGKTLLATFDEEMDVEPIGRLHLERIEMTPVGIQRGELVSSIPLAPQETVNLSHREWSLTEEQFESIIVDSLEGFSERGVTEKTDAAQSYQTEQSRSTALNLGAAVSASGMGVTMSASTSYASTSNEARSQEDSRNQSMQSTRKASSRVRKDHKTSFRVTSSSGSEATTDRVITNPSDTQSMRIDYFQMMRKWKVDLYRFGLRMTYDVVIPNPGADLIRMHEEIEALDAQIQTPFHFPLQPHDITRHNWMQTAASYGAEIDPPPVEVINKATTISIDVPDAEAHENRAGTAIIEVDEGYYLDAFSIHMAGRTSTEDEDENLDVDFPDYMRFRRGVIEIPYRHRHILNASIILPFTVRVMWETEQAWQFRAWSKLRDAAENRYLRDMQKLKDAKAALEDKLNAFDGLTLRRMEMEEIQKGVLRWIFGPSFDVSPADIAALLGKMDANDPFDRDAINPSSLTQAQWARMLSFGEFVKYIHNAIEWENLLYFPYPYFWGGPPSWGLKRFLQHPDPTHRRFLRAGAARVVLTIRPGFEKSFTELVETGAFGGLDDDHPYVTIAEEIQNYAKTNYPGIPPANPTNPPTEEEVEEAERGQLQATWWEYTPTSALDLQLNTALPDMA